MELYDEHREEVQHLDEKKYDLPEDLQRLYVKYVEQPHSDGSIADSNSDQMSNQDQSQSQQQLYVFVWIT